MRAERRCCGDAGATLRVVVATPVRLYGEGLTLILRGEAVDVVGIAADGPEALAAVDALRPDVLVLDPSIRDGVAVVDAAARLEPPARVIVFSATDDELEVLAYAEAGVAGYIGLDSSTHELAEVIRSAAKDELLCSPAIAAALLRRVRSLARGSRQATVEVPLTARELEIAELIDAGLSNKQIAFRLCIELATVKNHVHNILEKLEVARRGEAVARLRDAGMLHSGRPA